MTMSDTNGTQNHRYHCKFSGCDKSFQRREHLARHARTHSESKYVCQVCQKQFTRSDSLQRHLGLHGEAFKPGPSNRSKRACVTCHSSKIKCDGEQPCSRCKKKSIDCHYDQTDPDIQKEASQNTSPGPLFGYRVSHEGEEDSANSHSLRKDQSSSSTNNLETQISFEERLSAAMNRNRGLIDWTSVAVKPLPATLNFSDAPYGVLQPSSEDDSWPLIPDGDKTKFAKIYFTQFHHRWPVLHAPTFEADVAPPVLRSCVVMIGAQIHGSESSKELVSKLSARSFEYIFRCLAQISPEDSLDDVLTLALCEASLLYVIFGFYCGKEKSVSSAIMVRGLLIAALRELGLFKSELPVPYDKPGYFVPLRLAKEGLKQRLATCLFKIDSYLALLRCQPELLAPEELDFRLPSTFALWNCHGLDIWQTRHSIEPLSRSQTTVSRFIHEPSLESCNQVDGLMLIEDIQLGICAMHSKVWQLRERFWGNLDQEITCAIERDVLEQRLDAWKQLVFRLPFQQGDHIDFSEEQHLAMRYYYGIENHVEPGWQLIVFDRPKDLIFDTLSLYHLISIHLFADVRTLTQLAKDEHPSAPVDFPGEAYLKAKERREASTSLWVESVAVRRALTHATDILVSFNNISGLQTTSVDPIVFVAISVAALVVWAYCSQSEKRCPDCLSKEQNIPLIDTLAVELTKWSGPKTSQFLEKDRELWIETGACRGALTGLPLCRCNIGLLMAKFRTCIPQGWNVAETIAPGIFNSLG